MSPLTFLPPSLSVEYLRRLVNVHERWSLTIRYGRLPSSVCASLRNVSPQQFKATIIINPKFHFTGKAMARTITHELLELSLWNLWAVFLDTLAVVENPEIRSDLESRMRRERDRQIDERLKGMPFWTEFDIPVLKSAVQEYELT
jgi:hypothetical protein